MILLEKVSQKYFWWGKYCKKNTFGGESIAKKILLVGEGIAKKILLVGKVLKKYVI